MIAGIYLWKASVNQNRIKILFLGMKFNFECWCKGNYLIGEQGQGSNEDMKIGNTSLTYCIKHKYKNNKSNYSSFQFSSPSSVLSSSKSSFSFFVFVLFDSYTPPVSFGILRFEREIKLSHTHKHIQRQAKCRLGFGFSLQWTLTDMILCTLADRYQPKFRRKTPTRFPTLKWVTKNVLLDFCS
jgi:hypothetical protein